MNQQSRRTLQETRTSLAPGQVLVAAKRFFADRPSIYAAFVEQESDTHLSLRGQGGEEILIAVRPVPGGTAVTGPTYLFDQQVLRFFSMLPPVPDEAVQVPENAMEAPEVPGATGAA